MQYYCGPYEFQGNSYFILEESDWPTAASKGTAVIESAPPTPRLIACTSRGARSGSSAPPTASRRHCGSSRRRLPQIPITRVQTVAEKYELGNACLVLVARLRHERESLEPDAIPALVDHAEEITRRLHAALSQSV